MPQLGWLALIGTCGLLALLVHLHHVSLKNRHLKLRVQKLYASKLFEDLYPFLKATRKRRVDQLTIDKTGIAVRYLNPPGSESAFLLRREGYASFTPEQLEAMRLVLEQVLPSLCDSSCYALLRKRIRLVNGDVEYAFRYTIRNAYKAKLARAPYYDGSLQTKLW